MGDSAELPQLGGFTELRPGETSGPRGEPGSRLSSLSRRLRGLWNVLRANLLTLIGFCLVLVILVTALTVYLVPAVTGLFGHPVSALPYPTNQPVAARYQGPSAAHPFGTDNNGQDVLSRVLAALPVDLSIGLSITLLSLLFGGLLGLVAGFWDAPGTLGGIASVVILRVTDIFLAFPSLVLALAIAAALGRSFEDALIAVTATWWPFYVRLVRGEVLAVKSSPYVVAARAAGLPERKILTRHVIRNIAEPLVVYYTLDIGSVLITFSTLAFLAFPLPPGVPEWGTMISTYQSFLAFDGWPTLFVGLAVFVTVLAFSFLGDGLRDILDPRSRRALAVTGPPTGTAAVRGTAE